MSTSTQRGATEADTTEANKNILAALIVKADGDGNKEVKECLRAYKLGNSTKSIEASLKKYKPEALIKTLAFLNVKYDNTDKLKKAEIITELICRIENLLLDKCGMCGRQFATELDEQLLLQCKLCGQNTHLACLKTLLGGSYHDDLTSEEVARLINPLKLKGLHYLCDTCTKDTIPSEPGKKDGAKEQIVVGNNSPQSQKTNEISATPAEDDATRNAENEKPWRDRSDVCMLFLQSKCPHGISGKQCEKFHPRICNSYRKNGSHSKYGCSKGNACALYHPVICPNSLKSRKCFNNDCSYKWHLPRTIRVANNRPRHSQQLQYSNNPNNYHDNRQANILHRHRNFRSWKMQGQSHNDNNHYCDNINNNGFICDISDANDFPYLNGALQREGGCPGGDNQTGPSRPNPSSGSYTGKTNNLNNFSFHFLAQKLQDSIAQQVQAAFQQINIPDQIQKEISKLQIHSKSTQSNQAAVTDPKLVQLPAHIGNPLQYPQQMVQELQLPYQQTYYQYPPAPHQDSVNQLQY